MSQFLVACPTSPTAAKTFSMTGKINSRCCVKGSLLQYLPTYTSNIVASQSPSSLPTLTTGNAKFINNSWCVIKSIYPLSDSTVGSVWAYGIVLPLLVAVVVILGLVALPLYCWWRKKKSACKPTHNGSSSVKVSTIIILLLFMG